MFSQQAASIKYRGWSRSHLYFALQILFGAETQYTGDLPSFVDLPHLLNFVQRLFSVLDVAFVKVSVHVFEAFYRTFFKWCGLLKRLLLFLVL